MSYFLFESECKGTAFFWTDQIFSQKSAKKCIFLCFLALLRKKISVLAAVSDRSFEAGPTCGRCHRRYKWIVKCEGIARIYTQIFLKKNAIFLKKSAFFRKNRGHGLHFAWRSATERTPSVAPEESPLIPNWRYPSFGFAYLSRDCFL